MTGSYYVLRIQRENEFTIESAVSLFSGLLNLEKPSWLKKLLGKEMPAISFEMVSFNQRITFGVYVSDELFPYFESQVLASYPSAILEKINDPLEQINSSRFAVAKAPAPSNDNFKFGQMTSSNPHYPLKTYHEFKNVDPLAGILGVLSKCKNEEFAVVSYIVTGAGSWQKHIQGMIETGVVNEKGYVRRRSDERVLQQKITEAGFNITINLLTSSSNLLSALAGSFGAFARPDGNILKLTKPNFLSKTKVLKSIFNRQPFNNQILNVSELASLWHLPNRFLRIPNIAWGRAVSSEAPENLPVPFGLTDLQKKEINFFAKTEFRNRLTTFGIHREDRRRHVYVIGKTGVGKTTLIANMAINDIRHGEGVAVIDPHGDLSEILLNYIPSNRLNDVIYFNPADRERPLSLNPLEVLNKSQSELITSGIISIFYKLYSYSWGPRLEHILRNTLLTLTQVPNATLIQVPEILTNESFRKATVDKLTDPVLKSFWQNEFNKMSESLRSEAVSPILNKVGQFVSSPLIREIIGKPKSSISLEEIMNQGKILIVNLSQGRLGEDNAALLGAMLITKIQLAAMSRVNVTEEERKDFYLYVDEFQNFATDAFIKILSEARKYRLSITLANQYIGQIQEPVAKAIFGNAGTLISFSVGAADARMLYKEFGEKYSESELVSLSNYQIIVRLALNNLTTQPFSATTLPLPQCANQGKEKIIRVSRERYGRQNK